MAQPPRNPALSRVQSQSDLIPAPLNANNMVLITPAASPGCSPRQSPHSSPKVTPEPLFPEFRRSQAGNAHSDPLLEQFKRMSTKDQKTLLISLINASNREVLLSAKNEIEPKLRHDPFKIFPYELSLRVLAHLEEPKTLAAAAQVSKLWYFLLSDDSTWKVLCEYNHYRRLSAVKSYVHTWSRNSDTATHRHRQSARRASLLGDQPEQPTDANNNPIAVYRSRVLRGNEEPPNSVIDSDSEVSEHSQPPPRTRRLNFAYNMNNNSNAANVPNINASVSNNTTTTTNSQSSDATSNSDNSNEPNNNDDMSNNDQNAVNMPDIGPLQLAPHNPQQTANSQQQPAQTVRQIAPPGPSGPALVAQHPAPVVVTTDLASIHEPVNQIDGAASSESSDPIVEAYFDPQALDKPLPDSYRSYFRQEYLREHAWATGGRLAARYKLKQPVDATVTQIVSNDKYICIALDTSLILVFTAAGELKRSLYGHVMGVWALALKNKTLISGGCDRDVREWNLENGTCRHILRGHHSTVRCLAMADESTALSGGRDGVIRVWDLKQGLCLHKLHDHGNSIRRLSVVSALGRRLVVSGSYDFTAKIWDLDSGELLHTLASHTAPVYSLAVNKKFVATGSVDTAVKVWSIESGELIATLKGHASMVGQLEICNDKLVSASSDGSLRVWDLNSMECVHRIAAHDSTVSSLVVCNNHIISGGPDARVLVFNLENGEFIRQFHIQGMQTVWGISAKDDRMVIVYTANNAIIIELISFVCE